MDYGLWVMDDRLAGPAWFTSIRAETRDSSVEESFVSFGIPRKERDVDGWMDPTRRNYLPWIGLDWIRSVPRSEIFPVQPTGFLGCRMFMIRGEGGSVEGRSRVVNGWVSG
ncbi:hypothetical protein BO94DRAFT_121924 [Aspergillus sclerotioniger CBS 115572]|uniref:Uncharacterized protein n=1 Tax=Aspergillus sclerotioniger CBS 115572 TaxID=1450535 RepID=A0A317W9C5_9EURO|nr:hypothetical protein BO94DRAFT_121924 [Aspergillus sclerotioniger CBS 115572]PWY83224.1 hypothetical protein BO94DRAFT_121924 [Aspergillus sclerotioniger CBS 115572]